jgi:hypothetical protein
MGLMDLFNKPAPTLLRLPSGTFTVDRNGTLLARTLPSSFPGELVSDIALQVVAAFRDAAEVQLPLAELIIEYSSLRITARELRGGAIVFLSPKVYDSPVKNHQTTRV